VARNIIDVDALGLNAQPGERITLSGEVLFVGGHTRITIRRPSTTGVSHMASPGFLL
jgi:hypothetical protein